MDEVSAAAKVAIVNRALLKLGQPASYTIDGEIEIGGIADKCWLQTEALCMSLYDWSFARDTRALTRHATAPGNGWTHGFDLPGDRIGEPLAVLRQVSPGEAYLRDFMIEAGSLYCHIPQVWVRIRVALDPRYWDAGFAAAFVTALAAEMAVPLLQDEDLAAHLSMQAFGRPQETGGGGMFGRLIALNRAAQPQGRRFLDDDPLTTARFR